LEPPGRSDPGILVEVMWVGGSRFLGDLAIDAFCAVAIGEFTTSKPLVQIDEVEARA
jgi:hypothetical protein